MQNPLPYFNRRKGMTLTETVFFKACVKRLKILGITSESRWPKDILLQDGRSWRTTHSMVSSHEVPLTSFLSILLGFQTTENMTLLLVTCTKKHTEIKSFRLAFAQLNYTLWNSIPAKILLEKNMVLWFKQQETARCTCPSGKVAVNISM